MSITQYDAIEQVKRLASAGFNLSRDATAEGVAGMWADVLDVRPDEIKEAVSVHVRTGKFFPRPGDLLDIVRELRAKSGHMPTDLKARYLAWEQTNEGPCPVCDAVLQLVSAAQRGDVSAGPPRLGVFHDWRKHRESRIPHVGYPHPPIGAA